jgi:hypothetical protein
VGRATEREAEERELSGVVSGRAVRVRAVGEAQPAAGKAKAARRTR